MVIMSIPLLRTIGAYSLTEAGEAHSNTKSTLFSMSSKSSAAIPPAKLAKFSALSTSLSKKYAISIPLFSGAILPVIILAIAPQPIIPTFINNTLKKINKKNK